MPSLLAFRRERDENATLGLFEVNDWCACAKAKEEGRLKPCGRHAALLSFLPLSAVQWASFSVGLRRLQKQKQHRNNSKWTLEPVQNLF